MDDKITKINEEIKDAKIRGENIKNISDGHHTFDDLYREKVVLLALTCNSNSELAWKSKKHFDEKNDPMFNGDFIVGLITPKGIANFHIKLPYWNMFDIEELVHAPKYDGHSWDDDMNYLFSLNDEIKKKKLMKLK